MGCRAEEEICHDIMWLRLGMVEVCRRAGAGSQKKRPTREKVRNERRAGADRPHERWFNGENDIEGPRSARSPGPRIGMFWSR